VAAGKWFWTAKSVDIPKQQQCSPVRDDTCRLHKDWKGVYYVLSLYRFYLWLPFSFFICLLSYEKMK